MEQAFQDYLNEVVAYFAGIPVRRRDSMTVSKLEQARGYFEAGWRGGHAEGYADGGRDIAIQFELDCE